MTTLSTWYNQPCSWQKPFVWSSRIPHSSVSSDLQTGLDLNILWSMTVGREIGGKWAEFSDWRVVRPESSRSVFGIVIEIWIFIRGFHQYSFTASGWIYYVPHHALSTSLATYVSMLNTDTSSRDWPCQLADRDPRNHTHHFWWSQSGSANVEKWWILFGFWTIHTGGKNPFVWITKPMQSFLHLLSMWSNLWAEQISSQTLSL